MFFSEPASVHACVHPGLFARALHCYVYLHTSPECTPIQFRFHFEVRHITLCLRLNHVFVMVGGFDGAYISQIPFTLSPHQDTVCLHSGHVFQLLCGTRSYAVIICAAAHDAVAVGLLDGRIAIWSDISTSAVTTLPVLASVPSTDRLTDLQFSGSYLLVAYWSGTIACYPRSGAVIYPKSMIEIGPASNNNGFQNYGPTLIVQSPDMLYPKHPLAIFVTGDGNLLFVSLLDQVFIRRSIKSNGKRCFIKGICSLHHHILVWTTDLPELLTLQWPSLELFAQKRLKIQQGSNRTPSS